MRALPGGADEDGRFKELSLTTEQTEQQHLAEKAAALKGDRDDTAHRPENEDHADSGIVSKPFEDQAPSGAFDAEGHRPVLERSRKVR